MEDVLPAHHTHTPKFSDKNLFIIEYYLHHTDITDPKRMKVRYWEEGRREGGDEGCKEGWREVQHRYDFITTGGRKGGIEGGRERGRKLNITLSQFASLAALPQLGRAPCQAKQMKVRIPD